MNSVDGVELPPVTDVEQRFLTLEQLHRLADAAGLNRPLVYVWVAVRGGRRTALARHRSRASEHQDSRSVTEKREDGDLITCFDFKLYELRHTAASLAIQAGANIKALHNMLGHESAGLTLDRYGHLYGSDVKAVGVAINELLTRKWGQNVVTEPISA
ncbi:MAG: hypothetical protein K2X52_12475 [Mycobacteriaceae bacterium]|nr:hypothetical protein [Mycobacteriaceae bacterium]